MTAELLRANPETYRFPGTGQYIRVINIDGDPWFVASDAAGILELGNRRSSLALLDADEKGVHTVDTVGGPQQAAIVSEAGLYTLIMRSRKDQAKPFRRWVTHEVIPSIRRTGGYGTSAAALDSPADVLALAAAFHETAKRLVSAEQQVAALAPAAEAWEVLAEAAGDYSLRDAAHILNRDPAISTGQNRLKAFLADEGLIDRKGIPYVRYVRYLVERPVSYTHPHTGEPVLTHQIRITVAGLDFLRRRLGGIREVAA